jgi:hypothetical protein
MGKGELWSTSACRCSRLARLLANRRRWKPCWSICPTPTDPAAASCLGLKRKQACALHKLRNATHACLSRYTPASPPSPQRSPPRTQHSGLSTLFSPSPIPRHRAEGASPSPVPRPPSPVTAAKRPHPFPAFCAPSPAILPNLCIITLEQRKQPSGAQPQWLFDKRNQCSGAGHRPAPEPPFLRAQASLGNQGSPRLQGNSCVYHATRPPAAPRLLSTQHSGPSTQDSALSTQDSALRTQHSGLSTQDSALSTQHSALRTQHSALRTQHSALSTQHSALSTQHSGLSTQHSGLSTQHSGLSTQHSGLSTQDSALRTQHSLSPSPVTRPP